jgi:uncharacterized repeat protein (TIGR01451 family)
VGIAVVAQSTTVGTTTSNASVTATTNDPNPDNNFATEVTNIVAVPQPEADLAVAEVDLVDPVNAGDKISYTITVTNNGPDTAEGVVVTGTIPEGSTFFSATPQAACSERSGAVLCLLGDLSNGASVDIELVFTTSTYGNVTNTAAAASNTFDPVSDNNSGSATTLIQPSGSTVRILPLGDSFTRGTGKHPSYRYPLWVKLIDAGVDFDFVGSQNSNESGNPVFADHNGQSFDSDHEGHAGWRADEIVARLPKWLNSYTPDIVLLHIGTNDVSDNQSTQSTVNEIIQIIDVLRADNPSVKILLAKIIPTSSDQAKNDRINELNSQIVELAAQKHNLASPVIVVDQNSGFYAIQDTYDGIHLNASGRLKIAQKWFQAIINVLP